MVASASMTFEFAALLGLCRSSQHRAYPTRGSPETNSQADSQKRAIARSSPEATPKLIRVCESALDIRIDRGYFRRRERGYVHPNDVHGHI